MLRTALGLLGTNHELIKAVLAFLVSLIVSGAAWPTLELVQDFAKGADPSLIRHFILLVSCAVKCSACVSACCVCECVLRIGCCAVCINALCCRRCCRAAVCAVRACVCVCV